MQIIEMSSEGAMVQLTRYDLELLHDALNELCRHLDADAFETKMGHPLRDGQSLLEKLAKTYRGVVGS